VPRKVQAVTVNPAWIQVVIATTIAWVGAFGAAFVRHAGMRAMRPLVYLAATATNVMQRTSAL